jgi:D-aminopeptidase
MIEQAATDALRNPGAVAPYDPGSPCEIRVELAVSEEVERYRHSPIVEVADGRTLVSRADDWWTAWSQFYATFFRTID